MKMERGHQYLKDVRGVKGRQNFRKGAADKFLGTLKTEAAEL